MISRRSYQEKNNCYKKEKDCHESHMEEVRSGGKMANTTKVTSGQNVPDISKVIWKRSHQEKRRLISQRSYCNNKMKDMTGIMKVTWKRAHLI